MNRPYPRSARGYLSVHVPYDDDARDDDRADHEHAEQEHVARRRAAVGGVSWVLGHCCASLSTGMVSVLRLTVRRKWLSRQIQLLSDECLTTHGFPDSDLTTFTDAAPVTS